MSDEIFHEGVRYISAREAARLADVTRDYVARLARLKQIRARRVGKNWYVDEISLKEFLVKQEYFHAKRKNALVHDRKREYRKALRDAIAVAQGNQAVSSSKEPKAEVQFASSMRAAFGKVLARKNVPTIQRARVSPLYIAHPAFDFAHKVAALVTAFVLVFGTYAYVHPESAKFVLDEVRSLTSRFEISTDEQRSGSGAQLAAAAETSTIGRFSNYLWNILTGRRGSVYVVVEPYRAAPQAQAQYPTPVLAVPTSQPVTQRITETIHVVSNTPSNAYTSLATMLQDITNSLQWLVDTSYRQDVVISESSSGSALGGSLEDLTITNSTWIGGTITNATITGGSVTATAFNGVLPVANGGTGTSTYATGDLLYADAPDSLSTLGIGSNGQVLKVVGGALQWSTDIAGSGGASAWSTSTDELSIYTADPTDVVIIGASATSTTGNILEVVGNALVRGAITAYNTITAPIFTATSTSATSTLPNLSVTNLALGSLNGPLHANNGVVSATTSIGVTYGGTGLTTAPTYGQLLVGQANGTYALTATSSLGLLTFAYPFPNNATSTTLTFTQGLIAQASSTLFNLTAINATTTNATSTNFFATNAVFTGATTTNLAITGLTSALLA
ncbi:MAG TPA: helix-turn-helix domain-containing protein, partial [Candidatus Paceibacterota bacterium]|nr:helix-turn-helix domain-containing protein [Candidatus Paceibacterota bacterium]